MGLYQDLPDGQAKLSLVGLGYVGMPIAIEFAKHVKAIGFDINEEKIEQYKAGIDPTNEVGGVIWNDSEIAIDWPAMDISLVLSEKDARQPFLCKLGGAF